jgi:hypothetical protein
MVATNITNSGKQLNKFVRLADWKAELRLVAYLELLLQVSYEMRISGHFEPG